MSCINSDIKYKRFKFLSKTRKLCMSAPTFSLFKTNIAILCFSVLALFITTTVNAVSISSDPSDSTLNLTEVDDWQIERFSVIPDNVDGGIYVANNGSDDSGDGSIDKPYKTITHALQVAQAGTTLTLRGGTYNEMVKIRKPNMTIRSKTGETAKIVLPTDNDKLGVTVFFYPDADGGTLQGLEIVGGYYYGVMLQTKWGYSHEWPLSERMGATNVTIEDCIIHDTGRDAIKLTPQSDFAVIRRNEIYNTGVRHSGNAEGIDNVNSDNVLVQENYIHDIATNGVYCKGGATRCIIERNKIERTGGAGILVGFDTSPEYFDLEVNPARYENIDGIVRNNLVIDTQHSGIGLYAAKNAVVTNNTIVNSAQKYHSPIFFGISLQDWAVDNDLTDEIGFRPASVNIAIINNIVVQPASYANDTVQIRTMYHDSLGRINAIEGMPFLITIFIIKRTVNLNLPINDLPA